jgi:GT2 family glycosyltransferase
MAFRREVAEQVGYFDEKIKYGFDEVEFADRICRAGYKIALDPEVTVWHKHRSTLAEFMKQNFQYGKGSGLVLRKNKLKDSVSQWAFLGLTGFIMWVLIVGSLTYFNLTAGSNLTFWLLFSFTILPLFIVASVYAYRSLYNKKFARIVVFPLIDMFRTISFCLGQMYQVFKNA